MTLRIDTSAPAAIFERLQPDSFTLSSLNLDPGRPAASNGLPENRTEYIPWTGTLASPGAIDSAAARLHRQRVLQDAFTAAGDNTLSLIVMPAGPGPIVGEGKIDILQEAEAARRVVGSEAKVEAWIENPYKTHDGNAYGKRAAEAALGPRDPNTGIIALDPLHPEVQKTLRDVVRTAAASPIVSQINLDDHFSIAPERQQAFFDRHRDEIAASGLTPEQWGRNKLTEEMRAVAEIAHAAGKEVVLSLNGSVATAESTLQSPAQWIREGIVDKLEVQLYRETPEQFARDLAGLERSLLEIQNSDRNAFSALGEVRVAVTHTVNGKTLTDAERQQQLAALQAFEQRMAAKGIDVNLAIFDASRYRETTAPAGGTPSVAPLVAPQQR